MAEYIERERALEILQDSAYAYGDYSVERSVYLSAKERIGRIPAAGVASVRHGRWIITKEFNSIVDMAVSKYTCSACGEYRLSAVTLSQATKYCPNCGARMDEEEEI